MKLCFTPSAWDDYLWFQEHDRKLLKRSKPEPLKADLSGYWSRRINDEHRLVYSATATEIIVIACRYHYSK